MFKLISLELKRNNVRTYVVSSAISSVILLAFMYFVAYVAQVETGEREMQFQDYTNIFLITGVVGVMIFSTMSAIMYSRFVINEYSGKRVALLFSYPVSRKKILLAKLLLVFGFISVAMSIGITVPYIIFSITELVSPIVVQDDMELGLVINMIRVLKTAVLAVGAIGLIAMRIGFIKKSVPTTIVMSFILASIVGNVMVVTLGNSILSIVIIAVSLISAGIVIVELTQKIKYMEIE